MQHWFTDEIHIPLLPALGRVQADQVSDSFSVCCSSIAWCLLWSSAADLLNRNLLLDNLALHVCAPFSAPAVFRMKFRPCPASSPTVVSWRAQVQASACKKTTPIQRRWHETKKNALVSLNTTRFTTHFGEHCLVIPLCGCFCGFSSSVPAPRPSRRRRTKNENLQAKESDSAHKKGGKNTKTQRKKPKLPNNLGGAMRWKRKWLVVS